MKNLKKLVVIGAILGATHGAKAFEKEFEPAKDGENQGIELINGQLMVKTEGGKVADVDMPYTFVGTNTTNFAQSGFAVKEMADANSMFLDNNDVYFTRSSTNGVYKMTVSDKTALNGIGKVEFFESAEPVKVLLAKDGVIYTQNSDNKVVELGNIEAKEIPSVTLPESATANVYSVAPNGYTYVLEKNLWYNVVKYDGTTVEATMSDDWMDLENGPFKEMVAFDDNNIFVLREDGKLVKNGSTINKTVNSISRSKDGKSLLITSTNDKGKMIVSSYNTETNETTKVYDEANAPKKPFAKQEVRANGIKYFVRNKSIGYE